MKEYITESQIEQRGDDGRVNPLQLIELSKHVRELSQNLQKERLKSKQLAERLRFLETETLKLPKDGDVSKRGEQDTEKCLQLKSYQNRVKQNEELINNLRDKNASLAHELKIAQKVLEAETGETMNLHIWWKKLQTSERQIPGSGLISGGWRGRHQQIILLKEEVNKLKHKLNLSAQVQLDKCSVEPALGENFNGASTFYPEKSLSQSISLSREQLASEITTRTEYSLRTTKLEKENTELREEISALKTRFDRNKARERNVSVQLNEMRKKIERLLEKSKHDDELIQSLIAIQSELKQAAQEAKDKLKEAEEELHKRMDNWSSNEARLQAELKQLHDIARQKEEKVATLENELSRLERSTTKQTNGIQREGEQSIQDTHEKRVHLLTLERDGLREMVTRLNQRLDRITEEHRGLQRELKVLGKQEVKPKLDAVTRKMMQRTQGAKFDQTMTVEDWLERLTEPPSQSRSAPNRNQVEQRALRRAREEIISLKSTNQKLMDEKQELFESFTQLADKLQHSLVNNLTNETREFS